MKTISKIFHLIGNWKNPNLSESDIRTQRAVLSSLGQAANKLVQIIVTIVSVPLVITYLGTAKYGKIIAITGFAQWFLFDTGIAEGVKVKLLESFARSDSRLSRTYISTGFFALASVSIVICVAWCISLMLVDWSVAFDEKSSTETLQGLNIVVFIVLFLIPLKILREIYSAAQKAYVYFLLLAAGTLSTMAGILIAIYTDTGETGILLGMYLPVLVANLFCWVYLFYKDMPHLKPRFSDVSRRAWHAMKSDSAFLFLQGVALIVLGSTDIFIVNLILGGDKATTYSLTLRIFLYIQVIVSFVTYPSWSAIADAIHKKDHRWAKKASRLLLVMSMAFTTFAALTLVFLGKPLIYLWSGDKVITNHTLLILIAVYILLRVWCTVFAILLRSIGRLKTQSYATMLEALLHLGLGIASLHYFGLPGLAIGSIVSIAITRTWLLPLEYFRFAGNSALSNVG